MLCPSSILVALPDSHIFASSLAHIWGKQVIIPDIISFADGEIEIKLPRSVSFAGSDVCIIQSTRYAVHDSFMQMALLAQNLKSNGVRSISAIVPYFGYARHNISKKGDFSAIELMARMLEVAGVSKIITVEFHNIEVLPSMPVPLYSLSMVDCIAAHIKKTFSDLSSVCLVAPDSGATARVAQISHLLGVPYISFIKERCGVDTITIRAVHGEYVGSTAIIIDDIVNTAATALNVSDVLSGHGYKAVYGYFVHPVLSHDAIDRIASSNFTEIFVSNAIPLNKTVPKIKIFDIAKAVSEQLSQ